LLKVLRDRVNRLGDVQGNGIVVVVVSKHDGLSAARAASRLMRSVKACRAEVVMRGDVVMASFAGGGLCCLELGFV
jgi:hypothetical protein